MDLRCTRPSNLTADTVANYIIVADLPKRFPALPGVCRLSTNATSCSNSFCFDCSCDFMAALQGRPPRGNVRILAGLPPRGPGNLPTRYTTTPAQTDSSPGSAPHNPPGGKRQSPVACRHARRTPTSHAAHDQRPALGTRPQPWLSNDKGKGTHTRPLFYLYTLLRSVCTITRTPRPPSQVSNSLSPSSFHVPFFAFPAFSLMYIRP